MRIPPRAGSPLADRLADAAVAASLSSGDGSGLAVTPGGDGMAVRDTRPRDIPIRITGAPTGAAHPWVQVDDTDPAFPDDTGFGMDGSDATGFPAHDIGGSTADLTGRKFRAWLSPAGDKIVFDAGSATPGVWLARLTTSSGGRWKYFRLTLDGSGVWQDDGSESAGYTAVPSTIDGTTFCNPKADLRVVMWASKEAGFEEFLPIGYADFDQAGVVSLDEQYLGSAKKHVEFLYVNDDGATYGGYSGIVRIFGGIGAQGTDTAAIELTQGPYTTAGGATFAPWGVTIGPAHATVDYGATFGGERATDDVVVIWTEGGTDVDDEGNSWPKAQGVVYIGGGTDVAGSSFNPNAPYQGSFVRLVGFDNGGTYQLVAPNPDHGGAPELYVGQRIITVSAATSFGYTSGNADGSATGFAGLQFTGGLLTGYGMTGTGYLVLGIEDLRAPGFGTTTAAKSAVLVTKDNGDGTIEKIGTPAGTGMGVTYKLKLDVDAAGVPGLPYWGL